MDVCNFFQRIVVLLSKQNMEEETKYIKLWWLHYSKKYV